MPKLCKLNIHNWLYLSNFKTFTYHKTYNPLIYKQYACKHCGKIKLVTHKLNKVTAR